MNPLLPIPCLAMASIEPEVLFRSGLLVMKVTGPNPVEEFHVNDSPEVLFQWKGAAEVELIQDGRVTRVVIGEGQAFVIPARVPHRPVREAGTIGLVVELVCDPSQSRYAPARELLGGLPAGGG